MKKQMRKTHMSYDDVDNDKHNNNRVGRENKKNRNINRNLKKYCASIEMSLEPTDTSNTFK